MTEQLATTTRTLRVEPLTAEAFAPFGSVVEPLEDGTPMTPAEAVLDVSRGTARFYAMHLEDKPARFTGITRHRQVTQALAAVGGGSWLLAVAPPVDVDVEHAVPALDDVRAFEVPGDVAVLMHRGTWHAGPFFEGPEMSFFNLELSDTNQVDHQTHRLDRELGIEVVLEK